jgi:hypothetical protein
LTRAPADPVERVIYFPESNEAEYDGVVLAPGFTKSVDPPVFDDGNAVSGTWGGERFINLVKNGSAEAGWLTLRYWIERLLPAGGVNQRLVSWFDWRRTWPAFWPALKWQFITFWAGYGTGVADGPFWTRMLFAIVTAISIGGLILELFSGARRRRLSGDDVRFLLFVTISVSAVAVASVLRIDPVDPGGRIAYMPTARHAYVAIVPAAILLARGWASWWSPRLRAPALAVLVAIVLLTGVYLFLAVQRPWYTDLVCRQTACGSS